MLRQRFLGVATEAWTRRGTDPKTRLGAKGPKEVQEHPYWGFQDWELIGSRRQPSPLKDYVSSRLMKVRERDEASATSLANTAAEGEAGSVVTKMGQADALQKQAESITNDADMTSAESALLDKEFEMNVEGWEFASEHALAQEYIENLGNVVSIV